jgi:hypothetical protein
VLSVRSIEDLLNDSAPNEHNDSPPMRDAALLIRIVGLPSCAENISYASHVQEWQHEFEVTSASLLNRQTGE